MNIARALTILAETATARKRWGRNASTPYSTDQLMEAILLVRDAGHFEPVVSREEVTKLRRQLAACTNREKARKGETVETTETEE